MAGTQSSPQGLLALSFLPAQFSWVPAAESSPALSFFCPKILFYKPTHFFSLSLPVSAGAVSSIALLAAKSQREANLVSNLKGSRHQLRHQ